MMSGKRGANVGVLIAIFNLWLNLGCLAENNIGCLFNQSVCEEEGEQCYNDNAFGRCLRKFEEPNSEDLYRHDLDSKALQSLEREMQRLFALGYRWSHIYTQCVLQAMLESFRYQTEYGDSVCDTLIDQDLEVALKVIEEDGQEVDPDSVAYVKFTPSAANPHAEFADEVYFPPLVDDEIDPNLVVGLRVRDVDKGAEDYQFPESLITKKSYTEQYQRNIPMDAESLLLGRLLGAPQVFNTYYNTPDEFRAGIETRDVDEEDQYEQAEDTEQKATLNRHLNFLKEPRMGDGDDQQTPPQSSRHHGTPVGSRTGDGNDRITAQSGPHYNTPDGFRAGQETREEGRGDNERVDLTFSQDYNTPDRFRQGQESRDDVVFLDQDLREELLRFAGDDDNEIPGNLREFPVKERFTEDFQDQGSSRIKVPTRHLSPEVQQLASMFHDSKNTYQHQPSKGTGYTEGGLVFLPEHRNSATEPGSMSSRAEQAVLQDVLDDGLDELLGEYDAVDAGFKRRERLDVKKPGPQFSTNNYAFHHNGGEKEEAATDNNGRRAQLNMPRPTSRRNSGNEETVSNGHGDDDTKDNQQDATPHESPEKKEVVFSAGVPTSTALRYDVVDTTYAYVAFKTSIYEWEKGSTIVKKVAELLKLPFKTFKNIRVDNNEVTFKVGPNAQHLNASEVAKRIVDIKEELQTQTGVEVTSAGIGDKTKLPLVHAAGTESEHEMYIMAFFMCGMLAAVMVAAAALYLIRRHMRSRDKLNNLTAPDTEASKDYQELCRARMATKSQQDKPEPLHVGQRIASLSRESEGSNNSPSSRSSTSSWSEEPALTNMDISTGHMVLSYMEDHLKNKDRLEQEWVGLCAYEAEPCAITLALKPENANKNRYPDILPYDHARLVLNDLTNISGSDYINASTITDHDPRNPAYIATQGALPHTAPDFWQMVWEQGSVVMVMLTRLTENGNAMCHRYWPEEGSELYHIYELRRGRAGVHLVSEHIWCDDYLVRSFYLKNLKTGETRTVTQFHFLSWPDGGVPLSTKALLEFRRKVNKSYRGRSCPIVVHCSDGVGRTGTYCLIDMVLNRMAKGAKEIDIAATLEHIRDQRPQMVKTKQQFEFVLMAVAEEVNAILKSLPPQQQQPSQTPTAQQPQQQPAKQQ